MLALRSFQGPDELPQRYRASGSRQEASDWLSMQQAACELGVSNSTVRRMIRKGRLRNRIVPRRGGFAYLIYLPDSRHAQIRSTAAPIDARGRLSLIRPSTEEIDVTPASTDDASARDARIIALETQVERLSDALSRALRLKQRDLPVGIGDPTERMTDPYARYRWLVRRHWWWPF
jgi:excisionase family DNA binding protein